MFFAKGVGEKPPTTLGTPTTHEQMKALNPPYIWVMTPQNEGFTWVPMVDIFLGFFQV